MQAVMVPDLHQVALSAAPPFASDPQTAGDVFWRRAQTFVPTAAGATPCGLWPTAETSVVDPSKASVYSNMYSADTTRMYSAEASSVYSGKNNSAYSSKPSVYPGSAVPMPGQTSVYPGTTAIYPDNPMSMSGQPHISLPGPPRVPLPGQSRVPAYPGRVVPVPPTLAERVPALWDTRQEMTRPDLTRSRHDLTRPLFVDTTVEYDLPKDAYPPENSEPLLIVHPIYYEHLRHRRTLGAACTCQLCNFYGRHLPHGGQAAAAASSAAEAVSSTTGSASGDKAAASQVFQRPEMPPLCTSYQQQQSQHLLRQQQQQLQQQQRDQHLLQQQQLQRFQLQQQQGAARFNCRQLETTVLSDARLMYQQAGCDSELRAIGLCDSDSGYSSVELEPASSSGDRQPASCQQRPGCQTQASCQAPPVSQAQPACQREAEWCQPAAWCQRDTRWCQAADSQAREVLAKRKRRVEAEALEAAVKRQRLAAWQSEYVGPVGIGGAIV